MEKGAEKYGLSWTEVDLKTDMLEEMYDIYNYAILMELRMSNMMHIKSPSDKERAVLGRVKAAVQDLAYMVENGLPNFEGPTSAEWVANKEKQ